MNNYSEELEKDSLGLGYKSFLDADDDTSVAGLLNSKSGPGADVLPRESISAGELAKKILLPATLALAADKSLAAKWEAVLAILNKVDGIDSREATIAKMFADMVSDKLLTQEAVDSIVLRPASRAEMLFGPGTVCTPSEISESPPAAVATARNEAAIVAADKWKSDTKSALIKQARERVSNLVSGKIFDKTPDGVVPATDPFAAALQAVLDVGGTQSLTDRVLEPLAQAEMMRIGGGK